jgi:hypothetical protein
VVEGEGFEPSKPAATDLQSVPFDHSGTPPDEARSDEASSYLEKPNDSLVFQ